MPMQLLKALFGWEERSDGHSRCCCRSVLWANTQASIGPQSAIQYVAKRQTAEGSKGGKLIDRLPNPIGPLIQETDDGIVVL